MASVGDFRPRSYADTVVRDVPARVGQLFLAEPGLMPDPFKQFGAHARKGIRLDTSFGRLLPDPLPDGPRSAGTGRHALAPPQRQIPGDTALRHRLRPSNAFRTGVQVPPRPLSHRDVCAGEGAVATRDRAPASPRGHRMVTDARPTRRVGACQTVSSSRPGVFSKTPSLETRGTPRRSAVAAIHRSASCSRWQRACPMRWPATRSSA